MDTAIVVIGMVVPILAASLFYIGDRRRARRESGASDTEEQTGKTPSR